MLIWRNGTGLITVSLLAVILAAISRDATALDATNAVLEQERQAAAGIQQALLESANAGKTEFTIKPGNYRFTANSQWTLTAWNGIENMRIFAKDVTFIFEAWKFGLLLNECENLQIDGLTLEYDPLPYTQGRIIEIHDDALPGKSYIDYKTDDGFLPMARISKWFDEAAPTRSKTRPMVFTACTLMRLPLFIRIALPTPSTRIIILKRGDRLAIEHRTSGSAIIMYRCSNVTLKNVRIFSSPGGGITDLGHHEYAGGQRLENCAVERKPGMDRLLATNGDAFHAYLCRKGPQIIGCKASYVGDDFLNIRGMMSVVLEATSPTEMVICMRASFEALSVLYPGTTLRFLDHKTGQPCGDAKVVSSQSIERPDLAPMANDSPRTIGIHGINPNAMFLVKLEQPVQAKSLDNVIYPDDSCAGYRVENNRFSNGMARGVRLQTGNGEFIGNVIENTQGSSLSISMQCEWLEGGECKNITVRDNRFVNAFEFLTNRLIDLRIAKKAVPVNLFATVVLMSESRLGDVPSLTWPNNSNITFLNNRIEQSKGPAFYLANASDISLKGNRLQYASYLSDEVRIKLSAANLIYVLGVGTSSSEMKTDDNTFG